MVKHMPLAQVMIPGSWDQVPNWVPRREPASPSAYVSDSLSVSLINKQNLKKEEDRDDKHHVQRPRHRKV